MKRFLLFSLSIAIVCLSGQVFASSERELFKSFVDEADLIVEGYTIQQTRGDLKEVSTVIPQSKQSVFFKFGHIERTQFHITKVFKGLPAGDIDIISNPNTKKTIQKLTARKNYILFLERHPKLDAYVIMNRDQLQWQVFDYDGELRVKSWKQFPQLRSKEDYLAYGQFVDELQFFLDQENQNR